MTIELDPYFQSLPRTFRPERAGKWSAAIYFDVAGGEGWTLQVEKGTCSIAPGRQGQPSVEVSGAREVWERLARGEDNLKNAFVRGDLRTNHSAAILRLERAFEANHGNGSGDAPAGLRPDLVGRVLEEEPIPVGGAAMRAFAHATGETHPAYFDPDRPWMPILFPITLMRGIFFRLLTEEDTGGDVTRMVHAEQDVRVLAPLAPGDRATARARITQVEEVAHGESLAIEQRIEAGSDPRLEITSVLFFRDTSGKRRTLRNLHSRPHVSGRHGAAVLEGSATVGPDQPILYAEASGDSNPIHLDREFAKSLGFRDVLLQGTCTMAIAGRTIVEAAGAHPSRLTRLRVRFARPVFPGDTLRTLAWDAPGHAGPGRVYAFETLNQDGKRVLINGLAHLAD